MQRSPPASFLALPGTRAILDPIATIPGVMFFVKDAEYRYVAMSPTIREAIGLRPGDDPVGRTDFDLFPPLIARRFRDNDRLVIEEGRTLADEVHVVVPRAGPTRLVYSSKWPIRGHGGAIIGLVGTNRPHESAAGDESSRVLPAIARMMRDYSSRLSVADLADECGLSASHFMRLFWRRMGKTAHQFFEQVRIDEARRQLRETTRSVAEVAAACGFYDASAFVKRFRLHTGLTPRAYRTCRGQNGSLRPESAPQAEG
jgi:AraC-like DNA-binding protein